MHHGPSLSDLYVRLTRDKFCSTLDRFWNRFSRTWDVLLHGNPAADIFSGLKLASGGELGFGVGEEEWGSGERAVLEDLAHRTEGLVDVVVSRFGEPARSIASGDAYLPENEALPWMGSGNEPSAFDGVVFGGVSAVARPCLRSISLWMRRIYTYGEYAYGVRDNPFRERRKRRRRNPPPTELAKQANGGALAPRTSRDMDPKALRQQAHQNAAAEQEADGKGAVGPITLPKDPRPQIHGRTASHDHAAPTPEHTPTLVTSDRPGVPPPIVSAAERSLDKATQNADEDREHEGSEEEIAAGSSWGVPDTYMKYLTLGLSEIGKASKPKRPPAPKRVSTSSSHTLKQKPQQKPAPKSKATKQPSPTPEADEDGPMLTHMEPMPDGETLKAKISTQKRQENRGHFVIGLKGDLEEIPDDEDGSMTEGSFNNDSEGSRTVIRTLQIELSPDSGDSSEDEESLTNVLRRKASEADPSSQETLSDVKRLRVLVYVHRPFMYCFLFENRTSSLAYSSFYKELHRNLVPIHKPLLSSTNAAKVAHRIEASHEETAGETASVRSAGSNRLPYKGDAVSGEARPIFDLIYDPRLLTVHTSVPNIPDPGTLAAEGLLTGGGMPAGWTRIDALNVHSQILTTLQSIKHKPREIERTSKTSRGWWVVWMRVPPSGAPAIIVDEASSAAAASPTATLHGQAGNDINRTARTSPASRPFTVQGKQTQPDLHRMAFLVRKSTTADSSAKASASAMASTGSRMASGMWNTLTFRGPVGGPSDEEKTGGASAGWGPAALAGGIGIDARRYVEGLLSLNR